tara:strand:- start:292 stop:768 length:477 start_codon:yes stop_codon:yes gene_type:complete
MKKLFLTAVVALSTLVASAQFMVVTVYDNDQEENADKITANLGVGYMVNDAFTVGIARANEVHDEDHEGHAAGAHPEDEDKDKYNLFVRYNIAQVEGAYASLHIPTEDGSDNMKVGLGFAFNVWNGLYVEPNFTMPTSEDEVTGKREGTFNFGLSYRF